VTEKINTLFTTSPDGTQIAYDCNGSGPAVVLLHGGGSNRQEWHEAGYVGRLRDHFTVIAMDLRGHGESDLPEDPADYTTDKLCEDILAVADAYGVECFSLWGMSYGGKVGRYLAVQSERVNRFILMGTPLGPGVTGQPRQDALDFCAHWPPIVQAKRAGILDRTLLSQNDQELLQRLDVPAMLGWARAMLDWPTVEPADFRCPTLWLIGSEDRHAMESLKAYKGFLKGSKLQVHIIEELNHEQVFDDIDRVFPIMLAFTQA
jgi:pimeloyl-ACP methyl ester carboxylesterase